MRYWLRLSAAFLAASALTGCFADGREPSASVDPRHEAIVGPEGNTPSVVDDLARAKEAFRERRFGLAEKGFRAAIEKSPNEVEAWLGLAATHDQLGRYDLADKEYAQVRKRAGASLEFLNNRGYSYLLRGDFKRARADFSAAQRLDPDNEFLRNNLRTLDEKATGRG
jgi:Flp pilus assembly protein TadD